MDSAAEMLTAGTPAGRHLPGRRKCAHCPKMAAVRLMRRGPDGNLYGSGCHRKLFPGEYGNRAAAAPRAPREPRPARSKTSPQDGNQAALFDQPAREQPAMSQPATTPPTTARRFVLERNADPSGVSSTGIVLDGVVWPDGTVSCRWRGGDDEASFVTWASIEVAERKHCYGGHSRIVWVDDAPADGTPA